MNPATYITALGKSVPIHRVSQEQTVRFLSKTLNMNEEEIRRLHLLFRVTSIENRYSVLDDYSKLDHFSFYPNGNCDFPGTQARMAVYQKNALPLAIEAVEDALKAKADFKFSEITHLISISCTGMYAPGLDIDLINHFQMSPSVQRTCINFMGCYAAFNALKTADYICKSDPDAKVLVAGVELCSLHFQKSKKDDDLLATSLFGDGAAAILLEGRPSGKSLKLAAFHCDLAPNGSADMAWSIGDFGFEMRLSSYIPDLLKDKTTELVQSLFSKLNLGIENIQYFAIHPGGRKILDVILQNLKLDKESFSSSYHILKNFGNMSSVTVLFVLLDLWEKIPENSSGEKILSMAFGPGLTLESALFETTFSN